MKNLWGKVGSFIDKFEKTLDDDFKKRNTNYNTYISENEIYEDMEETLDKLNIQVYDNNTDIESKIEILKSNIKAIDNEIFSSKKIIEKYDNVLRNVTDSALPLIKEYKYKEKKLNDVLHKLEEAEKHNKCNLQEENSGCDNSSNDVEKLQKGIANELQVSKTLLDDIIQLEVDLYDELDKAERQESCELSNISRYNDIINRTEYLIESKIENDVKGVGNRIKLIRLKNEQLSLQLSGFMIEYDSLKDEFDIFLNNKNEKIRELKLLRKKQSIFDNVTYNLPINNMTENKNKQKAFIASIFRKYKIEKITLLQQKEKINGLNLEKEDNYNSIIKTNNNLISSLELESKDLDFKNKKCIEEATILKDQLFKQIDNYKKLISDNDTHLKTFSLRITKEISNIDAKIERLNDNIDENNQKYIENKKTFLNLDETSKTLEKQYKEIHDKLSKEMNQEENKITNLNIHLEDKKQVLNETDKKITEKKNTLNDLKKSKLLKRDQLRILKKRNSTGYETNSYASSGFYKWKDLVDQLSTLEKEFSELENYVVKTQKINVLLEKSLRVISEKQKNIDKLKSELSDLKDSFHKQLQELLS